MHRGESSIRVPVDIGIEASAHASRGGVASPKQRFIRVEPDNLRAGSVLLNPGTMQVHRVVAVADMGVTLTTGTGPMTFSWLDVRAALWQVVES